MNPYPSINQRVEIQIGGELGTSFRAIVRAINGDHAELRLIDRPIRKPPEGLRVILFYAAFDARYAIAADVTSYEETIPPTLRLHFQRASHFRIQRRQFFRVRVGIPVSALAAPIERKENTIDLTPPSRQKKHSSPTLHGQTIDLSAGGALIELNQQHNWPRATLLIVRLSLDDNDTLITDARVMRQHERYSTRLAVQFINLDETKRARLVRFLIQVQRQRVI